MPSPFSNILQRVNRDPARPLRILCFDTHEAYQTVMAETGHEFYSLQHPQLKRWDHRFRPLPKNYFPLVGNGLQEQLRVDMVFDLVLSQSKFGQYQQMIQIARALNCPLVSMEHTLPNPEWQNEQIEQMRNMRGTLNIYVSKYSIGAWGDDPNDPSIRIIHHGVDTSFFDGWCGGDGRILTVVNGYPTRDLWCGFTLYKGVTEGLQVNPWGDSPGLSTPTANTDHLREVYRNASVFLNTSQVSSCPVSLIEAMSVGCPVVTTATCMLPELVQDGVNGFITNDPVEMRARLELLLKDQELGRKLGAAARQTVKERFSQELFIGKWNQVFREAIES